MGVGNRLVLLEELQPLSPVTLVVRVRVQILFVIIGFISNIEDRIHEAGAEGGAALCALLVLVDPHLAVTAFHFSNTPVRLLLQTAQKRFFFHDTVLNIKVASALVLLLTQFTVLNDQIFALISAPDLIVQFLLLVALALRQVEHSSLALLLVQTLHDRVLLGHQAAPPLLTGLASTLIHCGLCLVFKTSAGQSESAIFSRFAWIHSGETHCHFRCFSLHRALLAGEILKRFTDSSLSIILLYACVDSLRPER